MHQIILSQFQIESNDSYM